MSAFVLDTSIALKWFLEDENDRAYSLTILSSLSDEYRPIVPPAKPTILQLPYLAREHRLISYDAAFLELAHRLQLTLATSDKDLIRAASECGVQLLTIPAKN